MVGLVDYGSGSESESETTVIAPPKTQGAASVASTQPKAPPKKKKIGIALPTLSNKPKHEDEEESSIDDRPTKKPRIGSGRSSLLGMLPAPKTNTPISAPKTRVLGGGGGPGLVFNSSSQSEGAATLTRQHPLSGGGHVSPGPEPSDDQTVSHSSTSKPSSKPFLLPPSLQKKRANVSLEETSANTPRPIVPPKPVAPPVDFFGLSTAISIVPKIPSPSSSLPTAPSLSAAPIVPEERIPEPAPSDPYPGYYQKPNGEWVQHEVEYYMKFQKKWQAEYDAHVRSMERGAVKGFEGYDAANAQEIDPVEEMERARKEVQEREERKALTKGAGAGPSEPKMKISAAKMSGVARSRHQLSTLLKEAYENREALEERIAMGKRNRKEAGNKYGF